MIIPVLKLVVFSLAPVLVFIWSTSPNLWGYILSLAILVGNDPSRVLHLLEDLPGRDNDLLSTGETLVKILTCDDLNFYYPDLSPPHLCDEGTPVSQPLSEEQVPPLHESFKALVCAPLHAPWLLSGLVLMEIDAYLPWVFCVSSLWSPFRETIPLIHWVVSWWFILLGWESTLVSLAPLSHTLPSRSLLLGSKLHHLR
ncbi:hypothetical protein DSO57_1003583 [Entomophthora muscae]|uniref:Uncharacterized protein n=1 Tax=Entomophthora muscae TaxID=34485 RepID=A0ACC2TW07_9FUNG|nr:hypothetical protein DSO57_1003583 [Entomophthora muscae]